MTTPQARTQPSRQYSDFSRIAADYDAIRDLPPPMLAACFGRLAQARLLPVSGRILDAGCGTGQLSLPLAASGYQVVGIDISASMAALARSKVRPGWQARYAVGDVRRIAAQDTSFDTIVVSKLFQHVRNWHQACRELIRVVRPGGCIIQVNERGAFGNAVRRQFARHADELGFRTRYAGLNPHGEGDAVLAAFMRSQGCESFATDMSDLRWTASIRYADALNQIERKLFAEFWYLPEDTHQAILAATRAWVEAQPAGADTVQTLTPYLTVQVFRTARPAAPDRLT